MALKAAQRKAIPRSKFVYPPGSRVGGKRGKYPITSPRRARAALAYSARSNTAGSYATVAKKVRRMYPGISTKGKKR